MVSTAIEVESGRSLWEDRYSNKHKPTRIIEFPAGIDPPQKVRIYQRNDYHQLQYWNPNSKRTQTLRVNGDLIDAISQAREIDKELVFTGRSNSFHEVSHERLTEKYFENLQMRVDADEIDPATLQRYRSAISRHYLDYCKNHVGDKYRSANRVNKDFQLRFSKYLTEKRITSNGHAKTEKRLMETNGQSFVMDCVKAMYQWASDPQRGDLLPANFVNPFLRKYRRSTRAIVRRISREEITTDMAIEFFQACDLFQLQIFAAILALGTRPGELGFMLWKEVSADSVNIVCHRELEYYTKGRIDKSLPLVGPIQDVFESLKDQSPNDLVFHNRRFMQDAELQSGKDDTSVVDDFRQQLTKIKSPTKLERVKLRDQVMRSHGWLSYDHIKREFGKLADKLGWSNRGSVKSLRHLFCTCLENAGVPEFFKKYMMGHSFGRAAIVNYTHITEEQVKRHYQRMIDQELSDVMDAIELRLHQLQNRA